MPSRSAPVSEYERKRLETIAKNKALLKDLALDAAVSGLAPPRSRVPQGAVNGPQKRKREAPKVKEEVQPRRVSHRIRGIQADSETAKIKAEEDYQAQQVADRAKRMRISGDLNVGDIIAPGQNWDIKGNFLRGIAPAKPYERTFDLEDVKDTTDSELRKLREQISGLSLWRDIEPARTCNSCLNC
jgi:hypothetical protein